MLFLERWASLGGERRDYISTDKLSSAGFDASIEQTGPGDVGPLLLTLSSPGTVHADPGGQPTEVTVALEYSYHWDWPGNIEMEVSGNTTVYPGSNGHTVAESYETYEEERFVLQPGVDPYQTYTIERITIEQGMLTRSYSTDDLLSEGFDPYIHFVP